MDKNSNECIKDCCKCKKYDNCDDKGEFDVCPKDTDENFDCCDCSMMATCEQCSPDCWDGRSNCSYAVESFEYEYWGQKGNEICDCGGCGGKCPYYYENQDI